MVLDEKRLKVLERILQSYSYNLEHDGECSALIRLALLGLWAEQYAVPALQSANNIVGFVSDGSQQNKCQRLIDQAIAALEKLR